MKLNSDQEIFGFGDDTALAALVFLARIEAPRSTALGGLYRLAVNDARLVAGLPADPLAQRHDQHVIDMRQ